MTALPDPPIRAVVFDLDGLMLNTEDLYQQVGTTMLARYGKEFTPELLDKMMGRQPGVALQIMIDYHQLDATVEDLQTQTAEIFEPLLETELRTMPGLLALLDAIEARGLPKAVATSSGRAFVEQTLGHFDLLPRFSFVLAAEDIENGKPNPEIYLTAAARFELEPAELLVLEDSGHGCRAAVAAGVYAVAVPSGHSLRHDFPGVKFIAESLADPRIHSLLSD